MFKNIVISTFMDITLLHFSLRSYVWPGGKNMKKLWEKFQYSEWLAIVLQILLVVISFIVLSVIGILINVWFVHFMKDTFGINVYWILHK